MDEMPSHAFTEWMAYYNLEPFGDELMDFHLAQITAMLYNANRAKNSKSKQVNDFRLWKQIKRTFNPEEFYENLKSYLKHSDGKKKE